MSSNLKVLYAAGPGDVIGTYGHWIKGSDDPSIVAVTYSSQFYDVCQKLDAQGYLISSHHRKDYIQDGRFILEHRPLSWRNGLGVLYHIGQLTYGIGLIWSALFYRADVVIVVEGSTHYFLLSLLSLFKVEVVPLLQCVLWPKLKKPSKLSLLIWKMSRRLLAVDCFSILAISRAINDQLNELTEQKTRPVYNYLPTYR